MRAFYIVNLTVKSEVLFFRVQELSVLYSNDNVGKKIWKSRKHGATVSAFLFRLVECLVGFFDPTAVTVNLVC